MKVNDLLKMEVVIDVCDDYDESCYIAFCGPVELTPAGREEFREALEAEIEMPKYSDFGDPALITVNNDKELKVVKKLFYGAAGYIAQSEYDRFFVG